MSKFSCPGFRALQNGTEMFFTSIPVKRLAELDIKVERYDATLFDQFREGLMTHDQLLQMQGYQRAVEKKRVTKFASYLKQDSAISPTVLLINDRDGGCKYHEETGQLVFDTEVPLFIFDGQHRKEGYLKAYEDQTKAVRRASREGVRDAFLLKALVDQKKAADFPLFVVITSGIDKRREMSQFRLINGTAKGVKTNLVVEIQAVLHDDARELAPKEARKVACNHAMHASNSREDSPWWGMIIRAGEKKIKRSRLKEDPDLVTQKILQSTSFSDSLIPIYDYLNTHKMWGSAGTNLKSRGERIAEVVIEFWKAVRELLPEPFEVPQDYLLHKAIGCMALHRVLHDLLPTMHRDRLAWSADEFERLLAASSWLTQAENWEVKGSPASNYAASTRAGAEKLAREIYESLACEVVPG